MIAVTLALVTVPRSDERIFVNEPVNGPTFIVSTGRCGSTALSNVLVRHPDVLSLSELLTSLGVDAIPATSLSGAEFWRILASPNPVFDAMIRGGVGLPEFLYPRAPGRFSVETTGIPALSLITLPHLTDEPDALLDELARVVPTWPRRPAAAQYEALFGWLCTRFGRHVVVERSGYSLHRVLKLRERFPNAKFVHLFRDGPDCAVSMSGHPGLRVILLRYRIIDRLGIGSLSELSPADLDALPPELSGIFPDRFDPAAVGQPLPVTAFGELWSRLIKEGLAALAEIPESCRISLCYEDLIESPDVELRRLADFIGIEPAAGWLESAGRILDPGKRGAAARLPAEELARLRESCAPGTRALARLRENAC